VTNLRGVIVVTKNTGYSDTQDSLGSHDSILHNQQLWDNRYQKEGHIWGDESSICARTIAERLQGTDKKVIDLGCGYGRDVIYLAKKGFQVIGVDLSEMGINTGKEWAKKECVEATLCIRKEINFTDYQEYFDAVISNRVMHLLIRPEERMEYLNEICHILKKGGLLSLTARSVNDPTRPKSHVNLDEPAQVRPGHWVKFFTHDEFYECFKSNFEIKSIAEIEERESDNPEKPTSVLHIIAEKWHCQK
jgi:SAM-dependent methyltransferase